MRKNILVVAYKTATLVYARAEKSGKYLGYSFSYKSYKDLEVIATTHATPLAEIEVYFYPELVSRGIMTKGQEFIPPLAQYEPKHTAAYWAEKI